MFVGGGVVSSPDEHIIDQNGVRSTASVPLVQVSHAIHELMKFFHILFFSVKCTPMNNTRERLLLKHRRRNLYVLFVITHFEQGVHIRIGSSHSLLLVKKRSVSVIRQQQIPRCHRTYSMHRYHTQRRNILPDHIPNHMPYHNRQMYQE